MAILVLASEAILFLSVYVDVSMTGTSREHCQIHQTLSQSIQQGTVIDAVEGGLQVQSDHAVKLIDHR